MEKEKIAELQYLLIIRKTLEDLKSRNKTEEEVKQILIKETDKKIDKLI